MVLVNDDLGLIFNLMKETSVCWYNNQHFREIFH